jgi:hypothetical protein
VADSALRRDKLLCTSKALQYSTRWTYNDTSDNVEAGRAGCEVCGDVHASHAHGCAPVVHVARTRRHPMSYKCSTQFAQRGIRHSECPRQRHSAPCTSLPPQAADSATTQAHHARRGCPQANAICEQQGVKSWYTGHATLPFTWVAHCAATCLSFSMPMARHRAKNSS